MMRHRSAAEVSRRDERLPMRLSRYRLICRGFARPKVEMDDEGFVNGQVMVRAMQLCSEDVVCIGDKPRFPRYSVYLSLK